MYPGHWAMINPDKVAVHMTSSGLELTYDQLNKNSNRLAQYWYDQGIRQGDSVALFAENCLEYFEVYWAALRSGLYVVPVNRYLLADEVAYILSDCGAKSVVTTTTVFDIAAQAFAAVSTCTEMLVIGGQSGKNTGDPKAYSAALAEGKEAPLADEPRGDVMVYSSGTTGKPKGIRRPLVEMNIAEVYEPHMPLMRLLKKDIDTRMLITAPLYHTAPLGHAMGVLTLGGTVYCTQKFDPEEALNAIALYGISHAYWVPTMFVRLIKMESELRARFDVSSLKVSVHTAAPCPADVKKAMMEWFGPTIYEYYGGSEFTGLTVALPEEWLQNPGTVGRAVMGIVHICDDDGAEVANGEVGTVYFENSRVGVNYHNDPGKSKDAQHPEHADWTTLGDVGYLNDKGFLYLTDRKTFMIISGGVNIYPQEVEDCLLAHDKILDAAVIGIPNPELGEDVKAIVELRDGVEASDELANDIIQFARSRIAHYKCPRSVDFTDALPRLPTGKLYKKKLREMYVTSSASA